MSLWNWKRSGWINLCLSAFLVISVITSICSTGIRSGFRALAPNFSFHNEIHQEIGVFNFFLFCSAIFGFINVALRYSYIMDQIQVMSTSVNYTNKISASLGIISFLGLIIIASFSSSVTEQINLFQTTGAYIFIGVGVIFTILQTALTYTSTRYSLTFIVRIFLAVILMTTFTSSIIFIEKSRLERLPSSNNTISIDNTTFSLTEFIGTATVKEETLLIACILEWISVIVYALFYLSFYQEFQTISAYVIMRPFISYPSNDYRTSSLTVNERV